MRKEMNYRQDKKLEKISMRRTGYCILNLYYTFSFYFVNENDDKRQKPFDHPKEFISLSLGQQIHYMIRYLEGIK